MEKYIKPAIEVLEMQYEEMLLATSNPINVYDDEELDASESL